jgi:hypothetical protein
MATYTNSVISATLTTALGGTPGVGDTANLTQGSIIYQAGIVLTGTLTAILGTSGFSGGFDPNPLEADVTTLNMQWSGNVWRHKGNITTAILDAAAGGLFAPVSGTTTNFYGKSGTAYFVDSAVVTNAWVAAPVGSSVQATFTTCGTAITAMTVGNNASVLLQRDITTLNQDGGETTIDSTTVTPTTINMRGGTLRPKTMGTCTTLTATGGIIDFRQLTADVTFTTANLYPGVTIYMPRPGLTVTFTTRNDFGGGPRLVYA